VASWHCICTFLDSSLFPMHACPEKVGEGVKPWDPFVRGQSPRQHDLLCVLVR
jgi:hypothetical protein